MLAGVVVIQTLLGLRETIARQIPNPHGAISHHKDFGRARQSVPLRFGKELFAQIVHAAAGHHRAATQYAGATAVAFDTLVQTETDAAINPMPAGGFLAGSAL